jgi:hypothetical protein
MKPQQLASTTLPGTEPAESSTTGTEAAGYHTHAEQTKNSVQLRTPSHHVEPANADHPKQTVLSPRRILKSVFAWINRKEPINQTESSQKLTSEARSGSTGIQVSKHENNSQVVGDAAAQVNLARHSASVQQDTANKARVNQRYLVEEQDDSEARLDSTRVTLSHDENITPANTASVDLATRLVSGQQDSVNEAHANQIPLVKDHDTSEARPGPIGLAISSEESNSPAVVSVDTMPENLATQSVAGCKGTTNDAYVSSSSEDDSSSSEESWLAPSMSVVSQERRHPMRIAAPSSIHDLPPVAQSRSSRIDFTGSITDVSGESFRWLPPSMLSRINTDGELSMLVSVTNEIISVYSNQSSAHDTPSLHESLTDQKPLRRENLIGASGLLSRSDSEHFDVESSEGPLNSTRKLSKTIDVDGVKSYSKPRIFRIQKLDGDDEKSFSDSKVRGVGNDEDGILGKRGDTEEPLENAVYRSPKVSFGNVEVIMELPRDAPSEAFSDIEHGQGTQRSNKESKRAGTWFCFKTILFLIVVGTAATLVYYFFFLSDNSNDIVPAATNITIRPTSTEGPAPTPTTIQQSQAPQNSPTVPPIAPSSEPPAPSLPTTSGDVLLNLLTRVSADNGTSLRDPSSPQFAAMEWLRSTDNTGVYTDRRFLARYALATLYYSTNGKDWKNSTKWLTKSHECNWFYANPNSTSCDDRNFIQIDLTENNLQGTLPSELSLLGLGRSQRASQMKVFCACVSFLTSSSFAEKLLLSGNTITGKIPPELSSLSELGK